MGHRVTLGRGRTECLSTQCPPFNVTLPPVRVYLILGGRKMGAGIWEQEYTLFINKLSWTTSSNGDYDALLCVMKIMAGGCTCLYNIWCKPFFISVV